RECPAWPTPGGKGGEESAEGFGTSPTPRVFCPAATALPPTTEITASCGPPRSAPLSSLSTSSGSCLNTKLTSAAALSVFGGEGMASFLIEFGAVILRFQARQQQSDGLVSFGQFMSHKVSFGQYLSDSIFRTVSFGLVSFGQYLSD